MTDLMIDRIREHVAAETVPELPLTDVLRRGRRVRRRRAAVRGGLTTAVVGALLGGAVVIGGAHDKTSFSADGVTSSISQDDVERVAAAYRTGGAFSRGHTLWFSDPDFSVDLGVTVQLMYYTADGVIAGVTNDVRGDARRDYVYVGTDGSVRRLDLPGKVVPGADAQADRFAYVTRASTGFEVHVVEASTGREIATTGFDAPYTWAGWDVPPIGLTGDYVVVGVDGAQRVIDWRTGRTAAEVPGVQLPSVGGGRALGGELEADVLRLGPSERLRSVRDLAGPGDGVFAMNALSPDGRFVLTSTTMRMLGRDGQVIGYSDGRTGEDVESPVVTVTSVDSGRRVTLPGDGFDYGWTPDGRLMRVDGRTVTTCDGATGACTERSVPDGPGTIKMAGKYLGS